MKVNIFLNANKSVLSNSETRRDFILLRPPGNKIDR